MSAHDPPRRRRSSTRLRSRRVSTRRGRRRAARRSRSSRSLVHSEVAPSAGRRGHAAAGVLRAGPPASGSRTTHAAGDGLRPAGRRHAAGLRLARADAHADYALTVTPLVRRRRPAAVTTSAYLAMLARFLVGASFIGAEYSTGSLANWLTFVPAAAQGVRLEGDRRGARAPPSLGAVAVFATLGLTVAQVTGHGDALVRARPRRRQRADGRWSSSASPGWRASSSPSLTRHTVAAIAIAAGATASSAAVLGRLHLRTPTARSAGCRRTCPRSTCGVPRARHDVHPVRRRRSPPDGVSGDSRSRSTSPSPTAASTGWSSLVVAVVVRGPRLPASRRHLSPRTPGCETRRVS